MGFSLQYPAMATSRAGSVSACGTLMNDCITLNKCLNMQIEITVTKSNGVLPNPQLVIFKHPSIKTFRQKGTSYKVKVLREWADC